MRTLMHNTKNIAMPLDRCKIKTLDSITFAMLNAYL